jgi:hypothetical protein
MTVVRDVNGAYVLGNGFAFGRDSEPGSGVVSLAEDAGFADAAPGLGAGVVTGAACPVVHPRAAMRTAATAMRTCAARDASGMSRRPAGLRRVRERVLRTRGIVWCGVRGGAESRE